MRSARHLSSSGSPKLWRWISRHPQATHSLTICVNSAWSICRMGRWIWQWRQMVHFELQALVVSMRTRGGKRPAARSMAPPIKRHTAMEENFPKVVMAAGFFLRARFHSSSAQRAGWSEAPLSRTPAQGPHAAGDDPIDARAVLGAEDLSHGVGHSRRGQQAVDLRIAGVGVQVAQEDGRFAQGKVKGNHVAKLRGAARVVAVRKMGQEHADGAVAVGQADQNGVAEAAAAMALQGNPLPELQRPR